MASARFSPAERKLLLKAILILSEQRDKASTIFYEHFFDMLPEAKSFLDGIDIKVQENALIQFLNTMILSLSSVEDVKPDIQAMKAQHQRHGVQDEHYLPIGDALLITLEEILGEEFTPEMEEAWMKVYTRLVILMRTTE